MNEVIHCNGIIIDHHEPRQDSVASTASMERMAYSKSSKEKERQLSLQIAGDG